MISFNFRLDNATNRPVFSQPETLADLESPGRRAEAFNSAVKLVDSFEHLATSVLELNNKPGVDQNHDDGVVAITNQGDFQSAVLNAEPPPGHRANLDVRLTDSARERHGFGRLEAGDDFITTDGPGRPSLRIDESRGILTMFFDE